MVKYYGPSIALVDALQDELRFLSYGPHEANYRIKNTKSKRKYDILERIFQDFIDLVYFLEFIEDHDELHDLYEDDLKDLFGVSDDNSSPQPHHYKNRSTSLLVRFLSASLLRRYGFSKELGFRVPLAYVMIYNAIEALQSAIEDNNERTLFLNNVINAKLWVELLAKRYKDERKNTDAHRRIGYCLPLTYDERLRMEQRRREEIRKIVPKELFTDRGEFNEKAFEGEVEMRLTSGVSDKQLKELYDTLLAREKP